MRLTEEELSKIQARYKGQKVHLIDALTSTSSTLKAPSKAPRNAHRAARMRRGATSEHLLLARQLIQAQIAFEEEFRFHPKRRWRFDFLVEKDLVVEIDGGLWINGGHSRGKGRESDMEKGNHATLLGYRTLRFTPDQVKNGQAIGFINNVLREGVRG